MTKKLSNDMTEFFRQTGRMGGKISGKRSVPTIGARVESVSTAEERSERAKKAAAEAPKKGARQRLPAAAVPTLKAPPVPTSRPQALILADQILNRLLGYARKGSQARKDFYGNALPTLAPRDLNWIADVWMRVEAREHDPLRPTSY